VQNFIRHFKVTLQDPEKRKWVEDKIKLNRVGEVEDIMGAVTFLATHGRPPNFYRKSIFAIM
jgi:hypothetical protein